MVIAMCWSLRSKALRAEGSLNELDRAARVVKEATNIAHRCVRKVAAAEHPAVAREQIELGRDFPGCASGSTEGVEAKLPCRGEIETRLAVGIAQRCLEFGRQARLSLSRRRGPAYCAIGQTPGWPVSTSICVTTASSSRTSLG